MSIDQDTDTDTGSRIFWMWSISLLAVTINVVLNGELMIAPLLANDKGTHLLLLMCKYRWYISYSFEIDVLSSLRYLILFFFA